MRQRMHVGRGSRGSAALVATDTVLITFPSGFITTQTVTIAAGPFATGVSITPTATTVLLTVAASQTIAAVSSVTVILAGATMGSCTYQTKAIRSKGVFIGGG